MTGIELFNLYVSLMCIMLALGVTAGVIFVWIHLLVWIYRGCRYGF